MNLNYTPTNMILKLIASVSEQLGGLIALQPENVHPESRKQARIDSIHATMQANTGPLNYGFSGAGILSVWHHRPVKSPVL